MTAYRDHFLYRDVQSRNILLLNGQPFFVDYQGGRKGALQYDIASLLFDAKADLPPELRQGLLNHYLDVLGQYIRLDREAFTRHYTPTFTCASCRPWALMDFAAFTS